MKRRLRNRWRNGHYLRRRDRKTRRRVVGSHGKEPRRAHTFALRQPCVISARRHVAFQCIISAGKMPPDMQNQISVRAALSPRLSRFHRLSLSLFILSRHDHYPAVSFRRLLHLLFYLLSLLFLVSSYFDR